jgi:hypothetical protein
MTLCRSCASSTACSALLGHGGGLPALLCYQDVKDGTAGALVGAAYHPRLYKLHVCRGDGLCQLSELQHCYSCQTGPQRQAHSDKSNHR